MVDFPLHLPADGPHFLVASARGYSALYRFPDHHLLQHYPADLAAIQIPAIRRKHAENRRDQGQSGTLFQGAQHIKTRERYLKAYPGRKKQQGNRRDAVHFLPYREEPCLQPVPETGHKDALRAGAFGDQIPESGLA